MTDSIKSKIINICIAFLSIVFIYLISLLLYYLKNNDLAFPHPNNIIVETLNLLKLSQTYKALFFSVLRLLLCICLSLIIAFILATLSFRFPYFKKIINPYITIFRTLPLISIIVLLIITVGTKISAFVVTVLVLAPLIYQNVLEGLESVPEDIVNAYRLDSKFNINVLFKLYVPQIVPSIKTALISSIGLGFKVLIMSEFISGTNYSLGYSLKDSYQNNIEMVYVYAWTLILIIISLIITKICDFLQEKK
jgi:NitT/TauT family transport system permease protein